VFHSHNVELLISPLHGRVLDLWVILYFGTMSHNDLNINMLILPDDESVCASNALASLAQYVHSIPVDSCKDKQDSASNGKEKKDHVTWDKKRKSKNFETDEGMVETNEGESADGVVMSTQGMLNFKRANYGKEKKDHVTWDKKRKSKNFETDEGMVETNEGESADGVVMSTQGMLNFKRANYRKLNSGGRTADPDCDAFRRKIYVPVYENGPFKGMWNIDPLGNTVTLQTTKLYSTMLRLIQDETTHKVYGNAPNGHMWFPRKNSDVTTYLAAITLNVNHYNYLWQNTTTSKRNVDKQQATVTKLMNILGFSHDVFEKDLVRLTFSVEKCTAQANALLKNGVGGSCGSKYRGRAVLLPMQ